MGSIFKAPKIPAPPPIQAPPEPDFSAEDEAREAEAAERERRRNHFAPPDAVCDPSGHVQLIHKTECKKPVYECQHF